MLSARLLLKGETLHVQGYNHYDLVDAIKYAFDRGKIWLTFVAPNRPIRV